MKKNEQTKKSDGFLTCTPIFFQYLHQNKAIKTKIFWGLESYTGSVSRSRTKTLEYLAF